MKQIIRSGIAPAVAAFTFLRGNALSGSAEPYLGTGEGEV